MPLCRFGPPHPFVGIRGTNELVIGVVTSKSNVPHPIIAIIVAVLLFGGTGYGIYHHVTKAPEQRGEVEQALFAPYFKALEDKRIDEAWERYTTSRYKERFPLEVYRAHWRATLSSQRFDRELMTANMSYDAVNRHEYLLVTYGFTFDNDYVHAVYHVVRDADGQQRIDGSGRLYSGRPLVDTEPW